LPNVSLALCPMESCARYGMYDICYADSDDIFPNCPIYQAIHERIGEDHKRAINKLFDDKGWDLDY